MKKRNRLYLANRKEKRIENRTVFINFDKETGDWNISWYTGFFPFHSEKSVEAAEKFCYDNGLIIHGITGDED